MNNLKSFLSELRRRKVWLVGGVYIVAAWVILQVAGSVEGAANLPAWTDTLVLVLLALGLPLAVILAWAQETQAVADSSEGVASGARELSSDKPSIAVLPFDNLSGEEQYGWLADGLVEEVITILAQNPRLRVIARNSTFTYKGEAVDIRDVGRELDVDYIVEGSVRKAGPQMRINVQLIEAETGAHVWSDRFSADAEEIFDVQDKVVEGIAGSLGDELWEAAIARHSRRPTENLGAWELYIRVGNFRAAPDPSEPEQLLRMALDRDPEFALAMAQLAALITRRGAFDGVTPERLAESKRLAGKALELSPNDPFVLSNVGQAFGYAGDTERGLRLCEAGVARAEGAVPGYAGLSAINAFLGNSRESLDSVDRATALSPRTLARSGLVGVAGIAHMQLGDLDEALEQVSDAIKFSPTWWTNAEYRHLQANILGMLGRFDEARDVLTRLKEDRPDFNEEALRSFYKRTYVGKWADLMTEGLRRAGIED